MYCVCTSRKCNDAVFQNIIYTSSNEKYILTITFLQEANGSYFTTVSGEPFQNSSIGTHLTYDLWISRYVIRLICKFRKTLFTHIFLFITKPNARIHTDGKCNNKW